MIWFLVVVDFDQQRQGLVWFVGYSQNNCLVVVASIEMSLDICLNVFLAFKQFIDFFSSFSNLQNIVHASLIFELPELSEEQLVYIA